MFEEVYKSIRKDNISQIKLSQIEENMNSIFNEAKDEDKSLIEFKWFKIISSPFKLYFEYKLIIVIAAFY